MVRTLCNGISFLPARSTPLSSEVVVIHGKEQNWVFDVGNSMNYANVLDSSNRQYAVFLSHFHQDHIGNIENLHNYKLLYCSKHTEKHLKSIEKYSIVEATMYFQDDIYLSCYPIPSTHAKGCIGVTVNEEISFLGDALYPGSANERPAYNVSRLYDLIDFLHGQKTSRIAISHRLPDLVSKEKALSFLEKIYQKREKYSPLIFIENIDMG